MLLWSAEVQKLLSWLSIKGYFITSKKGKSFLSSRINGKYRSRNIIKTLQKHFDIKKLHVKNRERTFWIPAFFIFLQVLHIKTSFTWTDLGKRNYRLEKLVNTLLSYLKLTTFQEIVFHKSLLKSYFA